MAPYVWMELKYFKIVGTFGVQPAINIELPTGTSQGNSDLLLVFAEDSPLRNLLWEDSGVPR
jgi:hypothetical protein